MMEVERERYLLPSNKMSEQKERKSERERERERQETPPASHPSKKKAEVWEDPFKEK
jgi:hypothetical protein